MIDPAILLALVSAVLFGASIPFAKLLLGSIDPWMMAGPHYHATLEHRHPRHPDVHHRHRHAAGRG